LKAKNLSVFLELVTAVLVHLPDQLLPGGRQLLMEVAQLLRQRLQHLEERPKRSAETRRETKTNDIRTQTRTNDLLRQEQTIC